MTALPPASAPFILAWMGIASDSSSVLSERRLPETSKIGRCTMRDLKLEDARPVRATSAVGAALLYPHRRLPASPHAANQGPNRAKRLRNAVRARKAQFHYVPAKFSAVFAMQCEIDGTGAELLGRRRLPVTASIGREQRPRS